MKKRGMIWMFGVVIWVMACTLGMGTPTPESQQVDEVGTVVAATMQALTEAAPPTPPNGIAVALGNAAFVIPDGLANGASGEDIPAITGTDLAPWDIPPAHLEFTLTGYALQDKFHQPRIYILPARDYADVNEDAFRNIAALKSSNTEWMVENLPHVPFFNAAQVFAAHIQFVTFQSGYGVRFLTEYAQYFASINNHDLFYQFQGLTSDGRYYIIVILPVTAPILVPDEEPDSPVPANGVTLPDINDPNVDFQPYYAAVTEKLNAVDANSFAPTLGQLDALVQSIQITP